MDNEEHLQKNPHIHLPSLEVVKKIVKKHGFDMTENEVGQYHDAMEDLLKSIGQISEAPQKKPPVKYPRTPGYRPNSEENKYNAWYYKCEIKGAPEGPLKGKKIAIKDNVYVAGVPMMNGSHTLEGFIPDVDATVVTRILDAGGVITGKAACEDLCFGGEGHTSAYGPVKNPHNMAYSSGGSSSGSAALVAAGEVDMAIGGDQGGSVRIPAAWCGIVGLKPTHGLVPYTGACSMDFCMDYLGPMAKNVMDVAQLLEMIAGFDGFDRRQPEFYNHPKYTEKINEDISGLKVGILTEGFIGCEPGVQTAVKEAIEKLHKSAGIVAEEVSVSAHKYGGALCMLTSVVMCDNVIRMGGTTPSNWGYQDPLLHDAMTRGWRARMNDASHQFILVSILDKYIQEFYGQHYYAKGCNLAGYCVDEYNKALEIHDVLIMPTTPKTAQKLYPAGLDVKTSLSRFFGMGQNLAIFNITGHPALTLPVGQVEGFPVGLQIVGRRFDETTVLKVALNIERLYT